MSYSIVTVAWLVGAATEWPPLSVSGCTAAVLYIWSHTWSTAVSVYRWPDRVQHRPRLSSHFLFHIPISSFLSCALFIFIPLLYPISSSLFSNSFLSSAVLLLLTSLSLSNPLSLHWMPFAMLIESISLANYNHNMQIVPMCSDRVLGEWDKSDWRENPLNLLIPPSLSKCVHPISSRCKLCLISFFNPFRGSGHTPPVLKWTPNPSGGTSNLFILKAK